MENKQKLGISIIIPALNEAENIVPLVERIHASCAPLTQYEVIIIDDRSTDETVLRAQQCAARYPVRVFSKRGERGKAQSLLEGFSYASYDVIGMIDADLQYPPEALPAMMEKLNQGSDVVVANRVQHEESIVRTVASKTFQFLFVRLLHGIACDSQSGLKVFRSQILNEISLSPSPWTFDLEFLVASRHRGWRIGTHDIVFAAREHGASKIRFLSSSWEIASHALRLRTKRFEPYHVAPRLDGHMVGAGVSHKARRFITHTTLHHTMSAVEPFVAGQKILLYAIISAVIVGAVLRPLQTGIVIMTTLSAIYFLDTVFNLYLVIRSLRTKPELTATDAELRAIENQALPLYTILCPLYKEADVLPHFLRAIAELDWPHEKLDVILLLEENDPETLASIKTTTLPSYVRAVVVPHSLPKTKPKACNFGLGYARGEYLVIYDAEDIPDPQQLKKAYLGFQKLPRNVGCLQAKLNYHNPHQNFLTRLFTAEYSLWFDITLTGLQSLNTYIPLGGTSNHFRTADLRALEGWDPFNVTEDCDLGARLFQRGFTTAIIDSTTLEEANSDWGNWLRQRSRWIKGYMQTYLVHMRHPVRFIRARGVHAFVFQLLVGGKVAFALINPILWITTIAYFSLRSVVGPTIETLFPSIVYSMAVFSLVAGNFLFLYYYMIGCARRQQWSLIKYIYCVPIYWMVTSVAAYKAMYQLFVRPHYWEKTKHGLHLAPTANSVLAETSVEPVVSTQDVAALPSLDVIEMPLQEGTTVTIASVAEPLEVAVTGEMLASVEIGSQAGSLTVEMPAVPMPAWPVRTLWWREVVSRILQFFLPRDATETGWVLIVAMIASNALNLLYNIILGRTVSFEHLGLIAFVNALWYVFFIFLGPLGSSVTYLVGHGSQTSSTTHAAWRPLVRGVTLVMSAVGVVWIGAAPYLTNFFHLPQQIIVMVFAPVLVAGAFANVVRGFLQGELRFIVVARLLLVEAGSKCLILVGFIALGRPELAYLSVPLCVSLTALYALRFRPEKRTVAAEAGTISFPWKFYAASLVTSVTSVIFITLDVILAKHYLDPNSAGIYALLSLVGKIVFFLGSLPSVFLIPLVARASGAGEDTTSIFRKIFTTTAVLTAVAYIGVATLRGFTAPLLWGSHASAVLPYIPLFTVGIAFFALSNVIMGYHIARRRYAYALVSLLFSVAFMSAIFYAHSSIGSIVTIGAVIHILQFVVLAGLHVADQVMPQLQRALFDFFDVFITVPAPHQAIAGKQRILIFNWRDVRHAYSGGAEVYVHEVARRLVTDGHTVTIFCGNDGASARHEVIDGVSIIRRGGFYFVYLWAFVYYVIQLRRTHDVIIDSHNGIPFFVPLYSRKPIYCLVHHVHQEVFTRALRFPLALFARFLEKVCMALVYRRVPFIAVSESSKQDILRLRMGRMGVAVVNPGVDLTLLQPGQKSAEPLVLYLGRLKEYKSLDVLLHAFTRVLAAEPTARLVIAGEGEELPRLQELAQDLRIAHATEFTGKVSEAEKISLLQQAWVFVNPSFMEGWGITTLEANACATPVVASDVPGLRDSVDAASSGFLVEYGDSQAFAERILHIVGSIEERHRLMNNAREWASRFAWDTTSRSLGSIITGQFAVVPRNGYARISLLVLAMVTASIFIRMVWHVNASSLMDTVQLPWSAKDGPAIERRVRIEKVTSRETDGQHVLTKIDIEPYD